MALDVERSRVLPGDLMIVPLNNTNLFQLETRLVEPIATVEVKPLTWLSTMSASTGAGFYSDSYGPFCPSPSDRCLPRNIRSFECGNRRRVDRSAQRVRPQCAARRRGNLHSRLAGRSQADSVPLMIVRVERRTPARLVQANAAVAACSRSFLRDAAAY